MVMEGDLTWGGEHTIQYTCDVLYNCTPETYVILLTNVTPINSVKKTPWKSLCNNLLFTLHNLITIINLTMRIRPPNCQHTELIPNPFFFLPRENKRNDIII